MKTFTNFLNQQYLNLILMLSTLGTVGSLIFSDYLGIEPCKACWYQRIALFPIVLISAIAMYRKDHQAKYYILALAVAGLFVSTLQVADEIFGTNTLALINCDAASCVEAAAPIFGPISIPMLAWVAFLLITAILVVVIKSPSTKKSST